jgi:hypothetical protein
MATSGLTVAASGSWTSGFVVLAMVCLWGMSLMVAVKGTWRLTWATALSAPVPSDPVAR